MSERYHGWIEEREDGTWFVDLGLSYGNPTWDFCWGGTVEFLTNSPHREITGMRIQMNKED